MSTVVQRRPSTGGRVPSSGALLSTSRSSKTGRIGESSSQKASKTPGSGGKAMASAAIHRVSSTTSQSSGAHYFHPNGPPIPERRSRGERPSSASGERGRPPIPGMPGDMHRPITPGPDMMRQMSVPGDIHRTHSAQDAHYRQYVPSSRGNSQDPMRQSGESRSSRSSADPSFNRNHSMNDGSSQTRRSSRRSSGSAMASVPENSKKSMPYPYPYMPGQTMPGQHVKMPRGMPAPYPMPGTSSRSAMPAPGQQMPMPGQPGHMPLHAQQMQVQMMMQQLQMKQQQYQKASMQMSGSSSSSDLQAGAHASPSPPPTVKATASSDRPTAVPEGEQGAADATMGASQGADASAGVQTEGAPQAQEGDVSAEASQQAPGWLALPAPGDVADPSADGVDPNDPNSHFFGTPEEQAAAAAAAGMDPALMGDAGALVLYNPEGGEPMQDESGALVLYQPPPVEQAETISQMLIVIQHLQGEVQSLRWALEQMRGEVDGKGAGGEGKASSMLPEGSAEEIKALLVQRDMQQRARLYNASSSREKDPLERLPNDKGELPKKFPHYRRDVVCMPTEIVTYLVEFYDLPKDPFETRLDRVAKFIGIRLA